MHACTVGVTASSDSRTGVAASVLAASVIRVPCSMPRNAPSTNSNGPATGTVVVVAAIVVDVDVEVLVVVDVLVVVAGSVVVVEATGGAIDVDTAVAVVVSAESDDPESEHAARITTADRTMAQPARVRTAPACSTE